MPSGFSDNSGVSSSASRVGWNTTWSAHDGTVWASAAVMCMFARATQERMRAIAPGVGAKDYRNSLNFNVGEVDGRGGGPFRLVTYAKQLIEIGQNLGTNADGFDPTVVLNAPYAEAATSGDQWGGDRIRLGTAINTYRQSGYDFLGLSYSTLQATVVYLAKCYYDQARDFNGYAAADYNADRQDYADYYWASDPSSFLTGNHPWPNRLYPAALYNKLPKFPGSNGFTRRREREISRLDDPGQDGQVARFVVRDGAIGSGSSGPACVVSGSGIPAHAYAVGDTYRIAANDPQAEIPQGASGRDYLPQCVTPRDQWRYSLKVMVRRGGQWHPADGSDQSGSTSTSTSGSGTGSTLTPDVVTSHGLGRTGDIVGPWNLNDVRDVLNAMTRTCSAVTIVTDALATPGGVSGSDSSGGVWAVREDVPTCASGQQVIGIAKIVNADAGISSAPCFCKRRATYFRVVQNTADGSFETHQIGVSDVSDSAYLPVCVDTFVNTSEHFEVNRFAMVDWDVEGGFEFTASRGDNTCDDSYPIDTCADLEPVPVIPSGGSTPSGCCPSVAGTYYSDDGNTLQVYINPDGVTGVVYCDLFGWIDNGAVNHNFTADVTSTGFTLREAAYTGAWDCRTLHLVGPGHSVTWHQIGCGEGSVSLPSGGGSDSTSFGGSGSSTAGSGTSSTATSSGASTSAGGSGGSAGGGTPPGGSCDSLLGTWLYTSSGVISTANTLEISGTGPDYTVTPTGGPAVGSPSTLHDNGDGTVTSNGTPGTLTDDCNKIAYGGDYWCRGGSCPGGGTSSGGEGGGGDTGSGSGGTGGSGSGPTPAGPYSYAFSNAFSR